MFTFSLSDWKFKIWWKWSKFVENASNLANMNMSNFCSEKRNDWFWLKYLEMKKPKTKNYLNEKVEGIRNSFLRKTNQFWPFWSKFVHFTAISTRRFLLKHRVKRWKTTSKYLFFFWLCNSCYRHIILVTDVLLLLMLTPPSALLLLMLTPPSILLLLMLTPPSILFLLMLTPP